MARWLVYAWLLACEALVWTRSRGGLLGPGGQSVAVFPVGLDQLKMRVDRLAEIADDANPSALIRQWARDTAQAVPDLLDPEASASWKTVSDGIPRPARALSPRDAESMIIDILNRPDITLETLRERLPTHSEDSRVKLLEWLARNRPVARLSQIRNAKIGIGKRTLEAWRRALLESER